MTSNSTDQTKPIDLFARLSYFTDLITHRRVLVVSDTPEPAQFLGRLNARYICSITESPVAAQNTRGGVEFKTVQYDNMAFRDGMFDVAIVPNLGEVADPAALLSELRRVVGRRGYVIAASPNPTCESPLSQVSEDAGIDYYQLYEILSKCFESVQMVGQAPFLGYAVSDLSASEDTAISFDGSLLENDAEEIEWFVALCGETPVDLEGYAIVQIPLSSVRFDDGASQEELARLEEENRELHAQRAKLMKEADRLEEDLRILEDEMRLQAKAVESAPSPAELESLKGELRRVKEEASLRAKELKSAPSSEELEAMKAELHRVKLEMGTRGVRIETLENDLEKERLEAEAARARAVQLAKQFDNERKASQARHIEQQMAMRGPGPEVKAELDKVKGELEETKTSLEAAEKSRDEALERAKQGAATLEQLRLQVRELQKKESEFVKREDALSDKLATAHQELRKALAQAEEAHKIKDLEKSLARSAQKEKEQQAAWTKLRGELDNALGKIDELERGASLDAEAYAEGNQRLEQRLKELGATIAAAQVELDRREALIRDLTVALANSEKAQNSGRQIEETISAEKQKMAELAATLESHTRALGEKDTRIAALESQLADLPRLVDTISQKDARIAELEAAPGAVNVPVSSVTQVDSEEISTRDKRIARLEADLQSSMWRSEELSARHDDALKTLKTVQATLQATEGRIADLETQLSQKSTATGAESVDGLLTAQQQQFEAKLDETRQKSEALQNELAAALGAVSGHHRARVEAELALASLEQRSQDIAKELDEAVVQNRALEEQLAAAMGAISGHHRARVEAELEIGVWQNNARKSAKELDELIVKNNQVEMALAETATLLQQQKAAQQEAEHALGVAGAETERLQQQLEVVTKKVETLEQQISNMEALGAIQHQARIETEQELEALKAKHLKLTESYDEILATLKQAQKELRQQTTDGQSISESTALLEQRHEEIEELKSTLTEAQNACGRLEDLVRIKDEELHFAKQKLVETEQQVAWMKTELSNAEGENQHLQNLLREQAEAMRILQQNFDGVCSHRDELQHANGALIHEKEQIQQNLNDSAGEVNRLRRDLGGADAELDRLREQLGNSHREVERLRNELGIAHGEINRLRHDLGGADAEINRLRGEMGNKDNHVNHIQGQLQQAESELHHLRDSVSNSRDEMERLQNEWRSADERIRQLSQELDESRMEGERLRNQTSGVGGELDEYRQQVAHAESESARLREEFAEVNAQMERLRQETSDVRAQLGDANGEMEKLRGDAERRESEFESARRELERLREEAGQLRNELDSANGALTGMRQVISATGEEKEALQRSIDDRNAELERKTGELFALQQRIDEAEGQAAQKVQHLEIAVADLKDRLKLEEERSRNAGADAAKWAGKTEELKDALENRMVELENARAARDGATRTLGVLRKELESAETRRAAKTIVTDDGKIQELTHQLEMAHHRREALEEEYRLVDAARASATNALEVLRRELESGDQQKEAVLTAQGETLAQLKASLQNTTDALGSQTAQLQSLSRQLADKDRVIDELKVEISGLLQKSTESDDAMEHQLLEMQQELDAAQLEYQDLQQKTEILQERLGQKEVQLSDTIGRLESLSSEADASSELKVLLRQKDEELKAAKDEVTEMQMEFAAKNLEISQARGNAKAAAEKAERLRKELELARAVGPQSIPEDVLAELTELKKVVEARDGQIAELEARNQESQPLIESLTDQLEQRERNVTRLEKKIRMLSSELKETDGDSVAWDMELKFRDAKIQALEEEIQELRGRLK